MLIRLDLNPLAKGRPRMTRTGHAYTPERTREYEQAVGFCLRVGMGATSALTGAVHLRLRFVFQRPKALQIRPADELPHTKRPDLDNLCKAILDAANGILWADDTQVAELEASKCYGTAGERAHILVYLEPMEQ